MINLGSQVAWWKRTHTHTHTHTCDVRPHVYGAPSNIMPAVVQQKGYRIRAFR